MRVVFPAESDLTIGKGHEPVVGNGNAMCVASQIVEKRAAARRKAASRTPPSLDGTASEGKSGMLPLAQVVEERRGSSVLRVCAANQAYRARATQKVNGTNGNRKGSRCSHRYIGEMLRHMTRMG
jgi:hypothetical protein